MFGIGDRANHKFLEQCAQAGKGMAYRTTDHNLHDLRYMIIDAIYRSSAPSLKNCSMQFLQG